MMNIDVLMNEMNMFAIKLLERDLQTTQQIKVVDIVELEENNIMISFKLENCNAILSATYKKCDIVSFLNIIQSCPKITIYDIRPEYLIGKWIAFKRDGMTQTLHGKVTSINKTHIKVISKKGNIKYCSFNDVLGLTSKPTKKNPLPKVYSFDNIELE